MYRKWRSSSSSEVVIIMDVATAIVAGKNRHQQTMPILTIIRIAADKEKKTKMATLITINSKAIIIDEGKGAIMATTSKTTITLITTIRASQTTILAAIIILQISNRESKWMVSIHLKKCS